MKLVKIRVNNKVFELSGQDKRIADIKNIVKNAIGGNNPADSLGKDGVWTIPKNSVDILRSKLAENNIKLKEINLSNAQTPQTKQVKQTRQLGQPEAPPSNLARSNNNAQLANTKNGKINIPNVSELLNQFKLDPNSAIHGMTGQEYVQEVIAIMICYDGRVSIEKSTNHPKYLLPLEASNLAIRCKQNDIATHVWHHWRDKSGKLNRHLDHKVSRAWIEHMYPGCLIVSYQLKGKQLEDKELETYSHPDVSDIVYRAHLIPYEDKQAFQLESNVLFQNYREALKPKTMDEIDEIRLHAKNIAAQMFAVRTADGMESGSDRYDIEWGSNKRPVRNENGEIVIKTHKIKRKGKDGEWMEIDTGKPVTKYKSAPNGRDPHFIAIKRTESAALAATIGEVDFSNVKNSQYKFDHNKTKFLNKNPDYNKLPDDNRNKEYALTQGYDQVERNKAANKVLTEEQQRAKFAQNVEDMRGPEEDGID